MTLRLCVCVLTQISADCTVLRDACGRVHRFHLGVIGGIHSIDGLDDPAGVGEGGVDITALRRRIIPRVEAQVADPGFVLIQIPAPVRLP